MNDIEKKALALLNECGWRGAYIKRKWNQRYEALCRAIERHEAFRQEVSDAVSGFFADDGFDRTGTLTHFIIADPDPLEEALRDAACDLSTDDFAKPSPSTAARSCGRTPMPKKNEPDWIEHDGSSECPVPAGHDVEVEYNWGKTYRCDNPELRDWTRITHYRDWTAFEQQQASAGESVPYWAWKRAVELTGPNRSSSQVLQDFARYIAAHEPKGEVPKLLTEAQVRTAASLGQDYLIEALRERGLIAPEPEPVDPLVAALASIDIGLSDHELQKLKDMGVTVTAPARGEEA